MDLFHQSGKSLRIHDMIFETDRLYARSWTLDDAEALYEIYRNPEVVQFLGATPKTTDSVEEAKSDLEQWLLAKARQSEGHDEWAIVRKEDQKVIGNIMCKSLPNNEKKPSGELEIGWHLGREYWHMGYASEAARAIAEYGFRVNPAIPRLLALVYSANVASQKVARNIGMEHLGLSSNYYGVELEVFELKRRE
jgi:RimJ/RimL family protein N-acetyltransferase